MPFLTTAIIIGLEMPKRILDLPSDERQPSRQRAAPVVPLAVGRRAPATMPVSTARKAR